MPGTGARANELRTQSQKEQTPSARGWSPTNPPVGAHLYARNGCQSE